MTRQTKRARRPLIERTIAAALEGQAGKDWYQNAAHICQLEADAIGCNVGMFIDVLAITSPRVHVAKNWRLAVNYLRYGRVDGMMRSVRAALAHYATTREIRGPKTSAFSRALKGDNDAIVLDVWMAAFFKHDQRGYSRQAGRIEAESAIRGAALALGWTCIEVQAAVWYAAVRRARRTPGTYDRTYQLHLFED